MKKHNRTNSDGSKQQRNKRWSSDSITKLRAEEVDYAVSIKIVGASNLPLREGMRVYLKVRFGKRKFKTRSVKGTTDPIWSDIFFLGPYEPTSSCEFTIWDKGSKWKKEVVAKAVFPFLAFDKEGTFQHVIQLESVSKTGGDPQPSGNIICSFKIEKNPLKRRSAVLGRKELEFWLKERPDAEELVHKKLLPTQSMSELLYHADPTGLVFGQSLDRVMNNQKEKYPNFEVPALVENAIEFLSQHLDETTGIFRMNPPVGKLNEVQAVIDASGVVDFGPQTDPDLVAALVKRFFRDLQPAILPSPKHFRNFSNDGLVAIRKKIEELPRINQLTLKKLMKFLNHVSLNPKLLMTANNLALMFAPNLYPPELYNTLRKATQQKAGNLKVEVVKAMVEHVSYIFGETDQVPAESTPQNVLSGGEDDSSSSSSDEETVAEMVTSGSGNLADLISPQPGSSSSLSPPPPQDVTPTVEEQDTPTPNETSSSSTPPDEQANQSPPPPSDDQTAN